MPQTNRSQRPAARSCLVLQGGGALGAYQAGVYQALHECGIEPDWVIGTSIGAINASLIAGNTPEMRLERLREFWQRVRYNRAGAAFRRSALHRVHGRQCIDGFGRRVAASSSPIRLPLPARMCVLGAEFAGYYSTRHSKPRLRN